MEIALLYGTRCIYIYNNGILLILSNLLWLRTLAAILLGISADNLRMQCLSKWLLLFCRIETKQQMESK